MLQSFYIIIIIIILVSAQCESVAGFVIHQPPIFLKGTTPIGTVVVGGHHVKNNHYHDPSLLLSLSYQRQEIYRQRSCTGSSRSSAASHTLWAKKKNDDGDIDSDSFDTTSSESKPSLSSPWSSLLLKPIVDDPKRSFLFSILMILCGAILGPFLDSYHSAFSVLEYDESTRITAILWGTSKFPALTTSWWVPELFGLAGFLIGWLYIIFDNNDTIIFLNDNIKNKEEEQTQITQTPTTTKSNTNNPSPVKVLLGISIFTLQYWISGILYYEYQFDRTTILNIMSLITALAFVVLDGTMTGFIVSTMTALGGPLIEIFLISGVLKGVGVSYHYNDLGETGFFPLWIVPVYFLGGPANGNLARLFWNLLTETETTTTTTVAETTITTTLPRSIPPCGVCNNTRRDDCPNCDGVGTYNAMGNIVTTCTCCNGRGYVMCRNCFDQYDEDPYDIEKIRDTMNRMPD